MKVKVDPGNEIFELSFSNFRWEIEFIQFFQCYTKTIYTHHWDVYKDHIQHDKQVFAPYAHRNS